MIGQSGEYNRGPFKLFGKQEVDVKKITVAPA